MSESLLTREELKKKAKDESDKADLKQHADKIILAFENSSPIDARRSLWELIQNARDLSPKAKIEVFLEPHQLSFTHYGETFDSNTLLCLIKQVSSKTRKKKEQKADQEEVKEVGQYGSGFLTTHSFGKRFLIDGTLKLQESQFVKLEGFEIDRVAKDSDELTGKLLIQQNSVFSLVENGTVTSSPSATTFRYQFDLEMEKASAAIAISRITESFIPAVMALNNQISAITISNVGANPNYSRTYKKLESYAEGELTVTPVQEDEQPPVNIYLLQVDKETDLKIILPLATVSSAMAPPATMSRLFLYFPLIGTEAWGFNFIIHCGLFNPHEKRDSIWISSDNVQNKDKEANNQQIIEKASQAIFSFMEKNSINVENAIYLADISFPTNTNNEFVDNYFKRLKATWVSKFRGYPLVETIAGRRSVNECYFLSQELLLEKEAISALYDLAFIFWQDLPLKKLAEDWTNTISKWEDDNIKWVSIGDICKKIQEGVPGSVNVILLQSFYSYLLRNNYHRYFDDFRLLPTYGNKYSVKTGLYKSTPLHPLFIEMAKTFAPKVPDQLVQDDFILQHSFKEYTRNELSRQLNPALKDISSKLRAGQLLTEPQKELLMRFCNSFPSLESKGARGELMQVVITFYGLTILPLQIPNAAEDKIDYAVAAECLIRHVIFDFATRASKEKDWTLVNLDIIKQLLAILTSNKEYSAHLDKMPIFVNRNFVLIAREQALIQKNIPDNLKTIYFNIFRKDKNDELLHEDFEVFHKEGKTLEGGQLAMDVIKFIESHGAIESINVHPDAKLIMTIIQFISDKDKQTSETWSKLFPAISAARATIVMAKIVEEKTKESLFSIITIDNPDKIALLGDLAKDEQMEVIIEYGRKAVHEETSRQFDFQLKHKIGTHIEELLRNKLGKDLTQIGIEVQVLNEQKGKDIVIKRGIDTLYYIEVKSRWRSDYSIRMSKTQAETAVTNPSNYTLLGVDMVDYNPADGNRHMRKS
jgi:hypothetical protein